FGLVPSLAIATAKRFAISRLVVGSRPYPRLVPGVCLLELSLAFEVPSPVLEAVAAAGLASLDQPALVPGSICFASSRLRRPRALEFLRCQTAVVIDVET